MKKNSITASISLCMKFNESEEIKFRIGLVEIFILAGSFFVAYSKNEIKQALIIFFFLYILSALLYYVFLTRTKLLAIVIYLSFFMSYVYSTLLLIFLDAYSSTSSLHQLLFFIALVAIFTFAFLPPEISDKITNFLKGSSENIYLKIILGILAILSVIYFILISIELFQK